VINSSGELLARSKSVDDTRSLAAGVAALVRPADIVVLAGELGAGKTAFVQGLARGLGITDRVTSPTFTLVHSYQGNLRLVHVDIYRLDRLDEVLDLGVLEDLEDGAAVACIEWGDLAEPVLPPDFLEVRLTYGDADDERLITLRTVGPAWSGRGRALGAAVEQWLVGPGR
jgi:tRNA threonylcarbamoyladenosine biosynthesis protein TsaE